MSKSQQQGNCAICSNFRPLTFEHIPPQCSFNDRPIFMQASEHLTNENSYLYGKKMMSSRGFGGYRLCQECNNSTGARDAKDFCDFAKQGMEFLKKKNSESPLVSGIYSIKPLNVLKQIVCMFMSANKSGYLRGREDLTTFLLHHESQMLPDDLKVYLYSNASPYKRFVGYFDKVIGLR